MKRLLRSFLLIVSAVAVLSAFQAVSARASVDDALGFALQAIDKYIKQGYSLREDTWGGDLGVGDAKAITHQLFKGNEYWFCLGSDVKGAKVSVHIYDNDGNLVEDDSWQQDGANDGAFAGVQVRPTKTGTYFLIVKVEKSGEERTPWGLVYAYK